VDQIKSQVDNLSELSDEQVTELQQAIVSEFEKVESQDISPETVDAMSSLADMLDTVRGDIQRRELQAEELASRASEAAMRVKGEGEGDVAPGEGTDVVPTEEVVPTDEPVAPVEKKVSPEYSTEDAASTTTEETLEFSTEATPDVVEPSTEGGEEVAPEETPTIETPTVEEVPQEEQVPVTAAAEEGFQAPADRQPVIQVKEPAQVAITAGADIPGYTAGSAIADMTEVAQAMEKRLHALRRVNGGDGEQHIVASFSTSYPEDRVLTTDPESNRSKIDAVVGQQALTASGGHAAPFEVKYDIFGLGSTTDRPVRDLLPKFQADRLQLQFGNLMTRAYPELISRHNELALVQHAREAELVLLDKISSASKAVNAHAATTEAANLIGVARDFLIQVRKAAVAYRSRHRLNPETRLKAIIPAWIYDAMAADLALSMPGDGTLGVGANEIKGYLAGSNVDLVASLDLNSFGAQPGASTKLLEFPDQFVWYLFAEGTFLFLDGGTLDLGIIRDSSLVNTNDYKMFIETFEGVAFVGVESLKITTSISVNGVAAALRDTTGGATAAAIEE